MQKPNVTVLIDILRCGLNRNYVIKLGWTYFPEEKGPKSDYLAGKS